MVFLKQAVHLLRKGNHCFHPRQPVEIVEEFVQVFFAFLPKPFDDGRFKDFLGFALGIV